MRVCLCYSGITFINPRSICCGNGDGSRKGNEFGLQNLWIYELAVYNGKLRIQEEKVQACELGMTNSWFFLRVGQQEAVTTDEVW